MEGELEIRQEARQLLNTSSQKMTGRELDSFPSPVAA